MAKCVADLYIYISALLYLNWMCQSVQQRFQPSPRSQRFPVLMRAFPRNCSLISSKLLWFQQLKFTILLTVHGRRYNTMSDMWVSICFGEKITNNHVVFDIFSVDQAASIDSSHQPCQSPLKPEAMAHQFIYDAIRCALHVLTHQVWNVEVPQVSYFRY